MCCQSWVVVVVVVVAVVGVIFGLDGKKKNCIRDRVSKAKIETRPSMNAGKKNKKGRLSSKRYPQSVITNDVKHGDSNHAGEMGRRRAGGTGR